MLKRLVFIVLVMLVGEVQGAIISPLASGAGHVAGGTMGNLFAGENLGDAFTHSFKGIGKSMLIGTGIGMMSTAGVSLAMRINPATGGLGRKEGQLSGI